MQDRDDLHAVLVDSIDHASAMHEDFPQVVGAVVLGHTAPLTGLFRERCDAFGETPGDGPALAGASRAMWSMMSRRFRRARGD